MSDAEQPDSNTTEFLGQTLDRFQQWIQLADAKAGFVLVVLGLGAADLVDRARALSDAHNLASNWGTAATWLFWMACIAAAATVSSVSITLFPRVKAQSRSLAFFGDVAQFKTSEEYGQEVEGLTRKRVDEAVGSQVWQLARIATTKYRWLRRSYVWVILFMVLLFSARLSFAWGAP
jgi:hypothetical protein